MQTTVVDLADEMKDRLKEISQEEKTTMAALIREALEKLIRARDRQQVKRVTP